MPKKIITREMLTVAINKDTGKGHYILKSMMLKHVKTHLVSAAEPLCGLFQLGKAAKSLHVSTSAVVTCKRCIQAFAKHEERQQTTLKLKEVKMLKTSDGKTFPLAKRKEALAHEDSLTERKKEHEFITAFENKFFIGDDGFLDEDAVDAFESTISNALSDHFKHLDTVSLEEFASFMYDILSEYGARIRLMVVLYQKLNGTLVPCRNTMEKMKDVGIYL